MNVACAHDDMPLRTGYLSEWTRYFDMSKETFCLSEKTASPLALRGAAPQPVFVDATTSGAGLARGAATLQEDAP